MSRKGEGMPAWVYGVMLVSFAISATIFAIGLKLSLRPVPYDVVAEAELIAALAWSRKSVQES